MGVVVFDSDVLIGFLRADDAHHQRAVDWMRAASAPDLDRLVSAVNYSEILVGPIRAGTREVVVRTLERARVEVVAIDSQLAARGAAVRADTGLKLPDAYPLALAIQAEDRGRGPVQLATFDERLRAADASLRDRPGD